MNKTTSIALLTSFLVIFNSTIGQSLNKTVNLTISVIAVIISIINVIFATVEFKKGKQDND